MRMEAKEGGLLSGSCDTFLSLSRLDPVVKRDVCIDPFRTAYCREVSLGFIYLVHSVS
jgi:hypothetical protein